MMKSKFLLLLSLSLLLSFLPYAMFGQTKVEAQGSQSVHNQNTGLNYTTIQGAIDARETKDGHTIKVDAGTYYESININKSITLTGENRDVTVIDGNGTGMPSGFLSTRAVVVINASGIQIRNLTIRNAGMSNVLAQYDACLNCIGQHDVYIENSTMRNAGWGIVFANNVSSITIRNNTLSDTVGGAINIGGWTSPNAVNVTISNNVINNATTGISLNGNTSNCRVLNNTVADGYVGIVLYPNVNNYLVPTNNLIDGNVLNNNSGVNIELVSSPNSTQSYYTNTFRRNNLTNVQHLNFYVWGSNPATFIQDIDSSNTVNNKKAYYATNISNAEINPTNSPDAGYLALVNCTNTTAKGFTFKSNNDGVLMAWSTNCTLRNITVQSNHVNVTNAFSKTSYTSLFGGLTLFQSKGNTITDSTLYNDTCGIVLCLSDNNTFYHNAFIDNDRQAISDRDSPLQNVSSGYFSRCSWNNSLEGNYWSDYNGTDANSNGIGDRPYTIDQNNTDQHPLLGKFNNFELSTPSKGPQPLSIITNSTISSPILTVWLSSPQNGLVTGQPCGIRFNVTGSNGTNGFCRVMTPKALVNLSSYVVLIDSTRVNATLLPASNSTFVDLYFTYSHSSHSVYVRIPEPQPIVQEEVWVPSTQGAAMAATVTIGSAALVSTLVSVAGSSLSEGGNQLGEKLDDILPSTVKKWLSDLISSKGKVEIQQGVGSWFMLTRTEIGSYAVTMAILTFAFAYAKSQSLGQMIESIPLVLATSISTGFVTNYTTTAISRRKGLWTEHRVWYFGLLLFVFSTLAFKVPFSSPSKMAHYHQKGKEEEDKRLDAQLSTILFGLTFIFALAFLILFISGHTEIGSVGLIMSLTAGLFDTMPIPPMGGKDIFDWNKPVWLTLFAISIASYAVFLLFL